MSRILFVYPNKEGYPIIPVGISILSGILKNRGHQTDIFDVTFMIPERLDHKAREDAGVVQKVDVQRFWGSGDKVDMEDEFRKKLASFRPDLIAVSIVENNYLCAKRLCELAKEATPAPIVVGGVFPTTVQDIFIQDRNIDLICMGEGEYPIAELADRLAQGKDLAGTCNVIVKRGGGVMQGPFAKYYDWDPPVFQDWEIFDKRHLIKPFMGKMYRTGFFELSRGFPHQCTYCVNHNYQKLFKGLGKYNRVRPLSQAMDEILHMKEHYGLELLFFIDENFLTMTKARLAAFCSEYRSRVGLPFYIMTRADSLLDEDKPRMLRECGCVTIGIGVESGNEDIRNKLMDKKIPNSVYEKAFANCHRHDIRTTANIMMGLPFETEENILESARFCRKLQAGASRWPSSRLIRAPNCARSASRTASWKTNSTKTST